MVTLAMGFGPGHIPSSTARTVLVVEDEAMVRMTIAEYLRDCHYTVIEAENATAAVEAMDADPSISLVFSDVRMPGTMDGFALAEWLGIHYPSVPVLLTSGYNGGRNLPARSLGRDQFIEKPYSQTMVANRIAAMLDV